MSPLRTPSRAGSPRTGAGGVKKSGQPSASPGFVPGPHHTSWYATRAPATTSPQRAPMPVPPATPVLITSWGAVASMSVRAPMAALTLPMPHLTTARLWQPSVPRCIEMPLTVSVVWPSRRGRRRRNSLSMATIMPIFIVVVLLWSTKITKNNEIFFSSLNLFDGRRVLKM